jgi:flagellar protein FliO/FliZ
MAAVAACLAAFPPAAQAVVIHRDETPLPTSLTSGSHHAGHSSDGAAFTRLGFGLVIVLVVIYAVYWLLKRSGKGRALRGAGALSVVDSTQLGPNRAVHLLRVGDELVLVGSAENAVSPIRVYGAEEARVLAESLERSATLSRGAGVPSGGGLAGVVEMLRRRTAR